MPNIILFDDPVIRAQLLPLTFTRPVAAIRCGIETVCEKWTALFGSTASWLTETYLQPKFPLIVAEDNIYVNGALCPDEGLFDAIEKLPFGSALVAGNEILAVRTGIWNPLDDPDSLQRISYTSSFTLLKNVWDIFVQNGAQLILDFARITKNRRSAGIADPFTICYNPENIFIEDGAIIKASALNAENGPVYIGRNALIQEGSMIQGPFAIGENSVLAQGTKIRPNTTVGPGCKVGGEVSNCVIFGFSNKGHDGYLGNSVIGEWCNLGANTNNSNLKNDHTNVKLHSYAENALIDTKLVFCGLIMGDYSKAGISTMFNTGTVVGASVNVFGGGFQAKHIPSFSWGGKAEGYSEYRFEKALAVIQDTVSQKGITFGDTDADILRSVFEKTKKHREG